MCVQGTAIEQNLIPGFESPAFVVAVSLKKRDKPIFTTA